MKDKTHVAPLDEVIGPTKERIPNVECQVVNNVLRQRKCGEEAVDANPAGDVQSKPEDGTHDGTGRASDTRSTRRFSKEAGSRIRTNASDAMGVS